VFEKFHKSTLGRSLDLLDNQEKRKVQLVVLLQVFLGFLDLVAIAIVGVLGALAVNGVQSRGPGNRVSTVLQVLGIGNETFRAQVAILGVGAAVILIFRTLMSIYFSRKILFFLSFKASTLSARLFSRAINEPLLSLRSKSSQELLFALTAGVTTVTMGILGTAAILVSDFSLLLIMAIGLFILDPILATCTLSVFGSISWILFKLLNSRAQLLGEKNAYLQVESSSRILEVLSSYREVVVSNRRSHYSREIHRVRYELAETIAELSFMPNISKYVIESAVVLGALVVAAVQFMLKDATHAVATLSVFLAAGARIAPAVMRIQQGAVSIKGSIGAATPTLNLIYELRNVKDEIQGEPLLTTDHRGFSPKVEIHNTSLTYPNTNKKALDSISLTINEGSFIALVGPSGAGKTSLVDVILGILNPSSGSVSISGTNPLTAFQTWPGAVAYLPQDIEIVNGTIRDNLCLGLNPSKVNEKLLWDALEAAQLNELVQSFPEGLDAPMGERGMKVSGGQRQRLGIARALLSKPLLLVLDEATSALDGETELRVTESLLALKGKVTIVMIAHRLSTVREADQIYYLDAGKITSQGTFEELRQRHPQFAEQADLMGL
jgi:ABC-type multidrug transport system fused ATPase/permease subunit